MATTNKQVLTKIWNIPIVRPYLYASPFRVRSDHVDLKRLLTNVQCLRKYTVWLIGLFQFDFKVVQRAGIKNEAVNNLFRLSTKGAKKAFFEDKAPDLTISEDWLQI